MNKPKTFLEPLLGYMVDTIAKLRQKAFVPHSLTKLHNIYYAKKETGAATAIEVGSFKGVTTRRLSRIFHQVISIEIDGDLHRQATEHCKSRNNIRLVHGDGSECLEAIVAGADAALLFLDGHYSGGVTGAGEEPEPVLKELDEIMAHINNVVAIVIDDFRLFGVEEGWPNKFEVMEKLERYFPSDRWRILVQYDQFLVLKKN